MNVYTLKEKHLEHHPGSHYFDKETLKFFGETMSSMNVLKDIHRVKDISGVVHQAYCLSSLQRNAPGGPKRNYTYFDTETFEQVIV